MKKLLISATAALVLASTAYASPNKNTGCGLGSMIIKDDSSAVMQALQATTNGTSGNQTFGITSGTLGCEKKDFVYNEQIQRYVASNMDQISKEIAMGKGESIDTLAELLNVSDKSSFAVNLQSNYNKIFTSSNSKMDTVLNNISKI